MKEAPQIKSDCAFVSFRPDKHMIKSGDLRNIEGDHSLHLQTSNGSVA